MAHDDELPEFDDYDDELPPEPGRPRISTPHGAPAQPEVAWKRPPPAVATVPDEAVQFLVKKEVNGRPTELGNIGCRASIDDIIENWFSALSTGGTIHLYPVGMNGRVIAGYEDRPDILEISPAHQAIDVVRKKLAMGMGGSSPTAPTQPDGSMLAMSNMFQAQMQMMQQQLNAANKRADAAEERRAAREEEATKNQLGIAMSRQDDMKDFFKEQQVREKESNNQVMSLLTTMMQERAAEDARRHERQMERDREERERERERHNADMERERQRAEQQRREEDERAARRWKEEEDYRKAREKEERQARAERQEREQQRYNQRITETQAHHERTLTLIREQNAANDPVQQATKLAGTVATVAGALGIDTKDIGGKLLGALGGGGGSIPELVASTVEKLADTAVKLKEADEGGEGGEEMVTVTLTDGTQRQMTRAQYEQLAAQAQQQQQQLPGPAEGDGFVYATGTPAQQPAPTQQQAQPQPQQPQQVAAPNPAAQLHPLQQKAGRKAAQAVFQAISQATDVARPGVLQTAVMQHGNDLAPYLQAVGLSHALQEVGANEQMVQWVRQTLQQAPVNIPPEYLR